MDRTVPDECQQGRARPDRWIRWPSPLRSLRRIDLVRVAGLAVLTGAVLLGQLISNPTRPRWQDALDIGAGVLCCALIPLLRRRTTPTALVLVVLAAFTPAAAPAAGTAMLVLPQRRPLRIAIAVGVVGALGQLWLALWSPVSDLALGWWALLDVAVFAALIGWGTVVADRRATLYALADRARRIESERDGQVAAARRAERHRIAREMHDVLAHRLSLLATYAGALEVRSDITVAQGQRAAAVIRSSAHEALQELRDVLGVPRTEDDDGSEQHGLRPQPTLADLSRLLAESRDAGMSVEEEIDVATAAGIRPALGRTAYRIVQEGLTNVRKHAPGEPVRVVVRGGPGADLSVLVVNRCRVADDRTCSAPGVGLIGLAERAASSGGEISAGPDGAGSFVVRARLPWAS